MKEKKVYTGNKFLTNKNMTENEKRSLFDFKHIQLELRRKELENKIAREEFEAKLEANTRKMMKKAKKAAKRAAYDVKLGASPVISILPHPKK